MPEPASVPGAPDVGAPDVGALARQAVRLLGEHGLWLATAESLTGGLLSAAVTGVPGASRVFRGGVVAYATDLKQALLQVDGGVLARVGAVDGEVAAQMAAGARDRLGADVGLSTTGVAGPDPQDGHPPGTVYVGLATAAGAMAFDVSVAGEHVGDREAVRERTVAAALVALIEHLSG